ncbi:MAG: RelA/SpoT family protein [Bacteroidales bacterium]|nr:RelA/SpoT family protein [Bacteroidales bacterium]
MGKSEELIRARFDALLDCSLHPLSNKEKVSLRKAFDLVNASYAGLKQSDGSPYILHDIAVAHSAMKEIGLGPTSAICALLHGINLRSDYQIPQIRNDFGDNVADIVEGFNKISELHTERISFQSDVFRTLFLSMVDDMRVVLILLAHRLNDIRNIGLLGDKRDAVLKEIKYIYTPIAHRLGLYNIKTEFEERLMLFEEPDIYNSISEKIKQSKAKREVFIQDFVRPLERELAKQYADFDIKWRTKSVPSIWAKMKRQNVEFDEVYDLFAIRILLNSKKSKEKEDCWKVYSIITNIYPPNPKRLRDWISTPKASGYESLHTTVMGPGNRWVEVQIRTRRMDETAEKGQAAHWQYKGVMSKKNTEDWLSQVRDILENPDQIIHDQAYRTANNRKDENIFVFTPKGDLKQLPKGSIILDFAYEIHTDVGASCTGGKVNGKLVPIRYVLKNGDKVDIVTSKKQKPKLDWIAFVATDRARSRIKRQLKEEKYREAEQGKILLNRKLKNWKIRSSEDVINLLVRYYKLETGIDLYYLIAKEKIDLAHVKKTIQQFAEKDNTSLRMSEVPQHTEDKQEGKTPEKTESEETIYIGDNLKNVDYRLAKCCNPIQGDSVFGFVTTMGGISIHRNNCPNAVRMRERYPYRVLAVRWLQQKDSPFSTINLRIVGKDELGVVGSITALVAADLRVKMRTVSFTTKGRQFEGRITVLVKNINHLNELTARLKKVSGVERVLRVK